METTRTIASLFQPAPPVVVLDDPIADPYRDQHQLIDPSFCHDCGAVYHDGHWQWMIPPFHAMQTCCAACRRMHENQPAADVLLAGQFVSGHRDALLALIQGLEKEMKALHPTWRLMSIAETDDRIIVKTTDIRLAHEIGVALQRTYGGELDLNYTSAHYLLRLRWIR